METVICAAFCGTGKSYLEKRYPEEYKDIEDYTWREGDFPDNYIKNIKSFIGKIPCLLISTEPVVLKRLYDSGCSNIVLVYPEIQLRNEYLDRYITRDSPYDFIGSMMKYWYDIITRIQSQSYCKHIQLKSGQYLENVITKILNK